MRTTALILAFASLLPMAPDADAQERQGQEGLEAYKAELRQRTQDGWWYASNAEYKENEDDADAYGIRHWLQPGGISAGGCLWSIREGELTVAWAFYQGWDATERRPFFYQAHASGTGTGMGYQTVDQPGDTTLVQTFRWIDGTGQRIRHVNEWIDPDTERSASQRWVDGAWQPGRVYTWQRRTTGPVPCGPGSDGR